MSLVEVVDELRWGFDSPHPWLMLGSMAVEVDPFPAYHHDPELSENTLLNCTEAFNLKNQPTVYLMAYESISRTNGFASHSEYWDDETDAWSAQLWEAHIALSAKRTPIHPAMTRYMVSHEYGHHVELEIARQRQMSVEDLRKEYSALRGADPDLFYGGGTWHDNARELLANDFRILVAGIETEYWPHPNFDLPTDREIERWWSQADRRIAA